jgi:hypothetical protein
MARFGPLILSVLGLAVNSAAQPADSAATWPAAGRPVEFAKPARKEPHQPGQRELTDDEVGISHGKRCFGHANSRCRCSLCPGLGG